MKKILAILLVSMLLVGCSAELHRVKVVEMYLHDDDANDGQVARTWRTTVELETGTRAILRGKYGAATGETFNLYFDSEAGWTFKQ